MTDDLGVWVYAVTRDLADSALAGLTGVAGGSPRTVPAGGLVAVVSAVDLAEFGEQPLAEHLEDVAWLEATARAHHRVVDAVARSAPVVPMRLATVYREDAGVRGMLTDRRTDLLAALQRIEGRVEFGVKGYARRAAEPASATTDSPGAGSGPGTAYLRRRRADLAAREQRHEAAITSAGEVHSGLGQFAEAARRHPPQHPRLSGETAPMVLNGAYLVDARRADDFTAAVNRLAERHPEVRLELTGPWPPYSFASVGENPR